ncbi:MAG TPA: site-specific integrase [Verrucomicrobiota bacterium]|jgi:integrase|nr:site-specific integrase [Verrucomicrobiota bacterium]
MGTKKWKREADGIYRHLRTNKLYWRPWIDGKRTWECLGTENLKLAKETYHKRVVGVSARGAERVASASPIPAGPTTGQVIRKYEEDGYPDKHKAHRIGPTLEDEKKHCKTLLQFWDGIPVDSAGPAACDRYHSWRNDQGFRHGLGNRQVDRELNTLNNACRWAARSELIKLNPLAQRPKYQCSSEIKHCREFMPQNANELHAAAAILFEHRNSVVLGFQMLFEAYTGLRTSEVLRFGEDDFGKTTEDGRFLKVWRCKNQHAINPYCNNHAGLQELLKAHAEWRAATFPRSRCFFPSHCGGPVGQGALAHALRRVEKKLPRRVRPHGLRAFYVLVRRSQGASDEQIAFELGHSSNGACIRSTYGGVPESWRNGGGPNMSWLPTGSLAWSKPQVNGWNFEAKEMPGNRVSKKRERDAKTDGDTLEEIVRAR